MGVLGIMLFLTDGQIDLYNELPYFAKNQIQRAMLDKFKEELTITSYAIEKLRRIKNIN